MTWDEDRKNEAMSIIAKIKNKILGQVNEERFSIPIVKFREGDNLVIELEALCDGYLSDDANVELSKILYKDMEIGNFEVRRFTFNKIGFKVNKD